MKLNIKHISRASVIAALYIILTLVSNMMGLASGAIQLRLSEALTLLPVIFPESIWGLFIGCFVSNILTGCVVWDIIFGSFATLIGAIISYKLKNNRFLASFAPVASNAVIVPFVLKYAYGLKDAWWYLCVTVGLGEFIVCFFLAPLVIKGVKKHLKSFN